MFLVFLCYNNIIYYNFHLLYFFLELLYKMNRTICNIKYDIMTLSEKIDLVLKSGNNVLGFGELTEEDKVQNEVFENLPLDNEEDLSVFENKLSNQEFRKKIVS